AEDEEGQAPQPAWLGALRGEVGDGECREDHDADEDVGTATEGGVPTLDVGTCSDSREEVDDAGDGEPGPYPLDGVPGQAPDARPREADEGAHETEVEEVLTDPCGWRRPHCARRH